jgi:hypothetical protein
MEKTKLKKFIPHFFAIVIFFLLGLSYFHPVLEGYKLMQGDIEKHKSMSHEIHSHKDKYGERALWSGNMFGGMPTYLTQTIRSDWNINQYLFAMAKGGLPHPASAVFAYLLGFYILLLCLRINPWLSIVGAIAFAFSSYLFIIIEAGHTSKIYAIAFMAPILGGFIESLRGNMRVGLLLVAIFTSIQLYVNHLQITYYLLFVLIAVGIGELVHAVKRGELKAFSKKIAFVLLAAMLGVLPNLGNLLITMEYSKQSTRGKTDLSITPGGESNHTDVSSGLDKSYITQWSYGIDETLTFIVPNAKGGNSYPILAKEEEVEKLQKEDPRFFNLLVTEYQSYQNAVSSYFGNQPITSGPVYLGVIVFMLAVLALFFIKDRLIISLGVVTILTIMLSWGKNFMGLTEIFIDYFPGYNKFRAVAMILVVAEFTIPIFALLFLNKLIQEREAILVQKKKLFMVLGGAAVLLLLVAMSPGSFVDILSDKEQGLLEQRLQSSNQGAIKAAQQLEAGLVSYRESLVTSSALSSLKYLLLAAAAILLFLYGKLNRKLFIFAIGALILVDMWSLDKQYVNNKKAENRSSGKYANWIKPEKFSIPFEASPADQYILNLELRKHPEINQRIQQRITERRKEEGTHFSQREQIDITYGELMESTHFRVMNTTARMDQDVKTPYFLKTLGGYHGAKLKKYQELVDFYLGIEHYQLGQAFAAGGEAYVKSILPRMQLSNAFNARYIIGVQKGKELVVENPYAFGNAWFIDQVNVVPNADSAMLALAKVDLRKVAVIEKADASTEDQQFSPKQAGSNIELSNYSPNELTYTYTAPEDQFVVFSEVYYAPGWNAYINGEKVPFTKVNYTMRGMKLPKGKGELQFRFEPVTYDVGMTLTAISSLAILLLIGFVSYREIKK